MSRAAADPFASVREATKKHRARHGCGAYPYSNGGLLAALAATANARRILELGTALGYTALCFAHGAPNAVIDTIEQDPEHVLLAREHVTAAGLDGHVVVHEGDFADVLPQLDPGFDIAFFDGFAPATQVGSSRLAHEIHSGSRVNPTSAAILKSLRSLLRARGLLISANLTHSGKSVDSYRAALLDEGKWLTAFVDKNRETAISIKL